LDVAQEATNATHTKVTNLALWNYLYFAPKSYLYSAQLAYKPHNTVNGQVIEANQFCEAKFGTGWRVAEFHDAWAWNMKAYGNVGTNVDRFWVDINDQDANCWSH